MRALLPLVLLVGAVACTTDPGDEIATGGSGAFYTRTGGSFDKLSFTPVDGVGLIQTDAALFDPLKASGAKSQLTILVADRNAVCTSGTTRQNLTTFVIEAYSDQPTFPVGSYTQKLAVGPGHVVVGVSKVNGACTFEGESYGSETATVNVTQLTATFVAGTFQITKFFGDYGTLEGSFNVPICPSLARNACAP